MKNNVLVSGGAGFVGSHLVDALLQEGHTVRVVDNLSTGFIRNLAGHGSRVELITGDIAVPEIAERSCRDIDFVFHEAALPSVPRSVANPIATQKAGEVATLQLLDACVKAKVRRFMFAASSSAYGGCETLPKVETMTPAPLSPYAASKLACEHYIAAFANCYALDTIALRYFNAFGPRQDPQSPYSAVISVFLSKMRHGQRPHINGDGEQSRDFTYVENVVHANLLAMKSSRALKGIVCNVGCGQRVTLNQLVAEINIGLGTELAPTYGPVREGDVRHSLADITRARDVLGYSPQVYFKEGIRRLISTTQGQGA